MFLKLTDTPSQEGVFVFYFPKTNTPFTSLDKENVMKATVFRMKSVIDNFDVDGSHADTLAFAHQEMRKQGLKPNEYHVEVTT